MKIILATLLVVLFFDATCQQDQRLIIVFLEGMGSQTLAAAKANGIDLGVLAKAKHTALLTNANHPDGREPLSFVTMLSTGKVLPKDHAGKNAEGDVVDGILKRAKASGYRTAYISDGDVFSAYASGLVRHTTNVKSIEDCKDLGKIPLDFFLASGKDEFRQLEIVKDIRRGLSNSGFQLNFKLNALNKGRLERPFSVVASPNSHDDRIELFQTGLSASVGVFGDAHKTISIVHSEMVPDAVRSQKQRQFYAAIKANARLASDIVRDAARQNTLVLIVLGPESQGVQLSYGEGGAALKLDAKRYGFSPAAFPVLIYGKRGAKLAQFCSVAEFHEQLSDWLGLN